MKLTSKRVILELLSAVDEPAPVAGVIEACEVLGFSENATRVALARLLAAGTVEATARGAYQISAENEALTRQVTSWRELEGTVRRWDGGWLCVHTARLARADRRALRRRERALRLLGFRELQRDLEVRPDNLDGGCTTVRDRLGALGLEPEALVFRAESFDAATEERARQLWDSRALDASYRRTRARIEAWLEREPAMSRRTAARESFLIGGETLRLILFDPRLPDPLVDVAERRALVDAMRRLDIVGRRVWHRLFGIERALGPRAPVDGEAMH